MNIVLVHVHIKDDYIEAFKKITIENARGSVQEPGVARFDVLQQEDDPTRFLLVEVYKDEAAPFDHKKSAHYLKWRSEAESMMAEPRYGVKYNNVFPGDEGW
jgi:(4S)-4-hydroxy-5-phosphonooxypentane-2,3-dione isomerase